MMLANNTSSRYTEIGDFSIATRTGADYEHSRNLRVYKTAENFFEKKQPKNLTKTQLGCVIRRRVRANPKGCLYEERQYRQNLLVVG